MFVWRVQLTPSPRFWAVPPQKAREKRSIVCEVCDGCLVGGGATQESRRKLLMSKVYFIRFVLSLSWENTGTSEE